MLSTFVNASPISGGATARIRARAQIHRGTLAGPRRLGRGRGVAVTTSSAISLLGRNIATSLSSRESTIVQRTRMRAPARQGRSTVVLTPLAMGSVKLPTIPTKFSTLKKYGHLLAATSAAVIAMSCLISPLWTHNSLAVVAADKSATWLMSCMRFIGAAHIMVFEAMWSLSRNPPKEMRSKVEAGLLAYALAAFYSGILSIRANAVTSMGGYMLYGYAGTLIAFYAFCLATE